MTELLYIVKGENMFELTEEQEERAKRLHEESTVINVMVGVASLLQYPKHVPAMMKRATELLRELPPSVFIYPALERMLMEEVISGRSDIEREWMELSGVDVFSVTVAPPTTSFEVAVGNIAIWQRKFDSLNYLVKATSSKDIEQAKARGKRAIIMGLQDSEYFGRDLDKLQSFYDLGIRIIQLTYNLRNFAGSGCTERTDEGLSHFGVSLTKRMNELGILIDVSHCGHQTMMDTIEVSSAPVAVTHSSSRRVYAHDRGKTDEEIKALAAKNGYFAVLTIPDFLSDSSKKEASLNDVLDHIDHIAGIMGVDKVGIGDDYGGSVPEPFKARRKAMATSTGFREEYRPTLDTVEGFRDMRDWPNITRGLVSRGYSDDEIKGILGGNFLRIFKEVVG